MSDEIKYVDADSEDFEDAPKALRDAYKKLVTAHKQATQSLAETRGQVAARAVADVLADKGFKNPERVKRDILADGIDPTDTSAVEGWLSENSDDYARAEGAATTEQTTEETKEATTVSQEVQLGYQNLSVPGTPATTNAKAVFDQITPEMNGADVAALYAQHGI